MTELTRKQQEENDNYFWDEMFRKGVKPKRSLWNNTPDDVRQLLRQGANVNATDEYGRTELMWAAGQCTTPEVIQIFIDSGADLNARDDNDWTPLTYAERWNANGQIRKLLEQNGAKGEA